MFFKMFFKVFLNIPNIYEKALVLESIFNKVAGLGQ